MIYVACMLRVSTESSTVRGMLHDLCCNGRLSRWPFAQLRVPRTATGSSRTQLCVAVIGSRTRAACKQAAAAAKKAKEAAAAKKEEESKWMVDLVEAVEQGNRPRVEVAPHMLLLVMSCSGLCQR